MPFEFAGSYSSMHFGISASYLLYLTVFLLLPLTSTGRAGWSFALAVVHRRHVDVVMFF